MSRVYCSADWHGCGEVARKTLEYIQPDDTLYYLGDCIDRGKDGIFLLDTLMHRPNTYFIKGNHEDMMRQCLPQIIADEQELGYWEPKGYDADVWQRNGGWHTYQNGLAGAPLHTLTSYQRFLSQLPVELRYQSPHGHEVILEHAGYTPLIPPRRNHSSLWDRGHFYDKWTDSEEGNNLYLVHGHTPVQYLQFEYGYEGQPSKSKSDLLIGRMWDSPEIDWKPEIICYCGGHKFDIDCCTIVSNRIALLDLDTFETTYIDA